MVARNEITIEYLKECLSYEKETGLFTWKNRPRNHFSSSRGWKIFNTTYAGKIAGHNAKQEDGQGGYTFIRLNNKLYRAHRLAWFYVNGCWPNNQIDHINRDRFDNRIKNLRDTTQTENVKNSSIRKDSKTGITGVHWYKNYKKWQVYIRVDGKSIFIGYFDNLLDAACARFSEEKKYGWY